MPDTLAHTARPHLHPRKKTSLHLYALGDSPTRAGHILVRPHGLVEVETFSIICRQGHSVIELIVAGHTGSAATTATSKVT